MANYGQGENRNSSYGMGGVPRTYNASPPPLGEVQDSGGSESDSGGGQDLECMQYMVHITLDVQYNNRKTKRLGGAVDPEDNFVKLKIKVSEAPEAHDRECKTSSNIDIPPGKECKLCMYHDPKEDFYGSLCRHPANNIGEFVTGPGPYIGPPLCAPENNCPPAYPGDKGGHCWARYNLSCRKSWLQCGKNEEFQELLDALGDRDDPGDHVQTGTGTMLTTGNMVVPWTVLNMINDWKAASKTPGKAGSEEKPCDICEFLCCLINTAILSEDQGLPTMEDCMQGGLWGSAGAGGAQDWRNPGWDPCVENVSHEFENWLLNSAEDELTLCRRGLDEGNPFEEYQHPCPGCCGEDDLGFQEK